MLEKKLKRKPNVFRTVTSLSIEEFDTLVVKLRAEWERREKERLNARKDRKNALGQGRKYALGGFSGLLLATVVYLRTNMGYELLGLLFGVDQSTIKRAVKRVIPLLQDRFIPKTELTKYKRRTNDLDELVKNYPDLKEVILDGTELSSQRPKRRQKQRYSGKKKRHTWKIQVALDNTPRVEFKGKKVKKRKNVADNIIQLQDQEEKPKVKRAKLIVGISLPCNGKIHDKKQLENTRWDDKLSDKVLRRGDSGYQGMPTDTWIIPHKKPRNGELTKKRKRENRKWAKLRIPVEHAIRGIKIFRRIAEIISIKSLHSLNQTILATANLCNFKRLMRQQETR